MRWPAPLSSLKMRLIALMALVVVPVAALAAALAAATDHSLWRGVQQIRRLSTADDAVRMQAWLKGAVGGLAAAAASANARRDDCATTLDDVVALDEAYLAIRVDFDDGHNCVGARDPDMASAVEQASRALRAKPLAAFAQGPPAALATSATKSGPFLAIATESRKSAARRWSATALTAMEPLDRLLALEPGPSGAVALMERGQHVIIAEGAAAADASWLPKTEAVGEGYEATEALSRGGRSFAYATQPVLGSQYYILRRFDAAGRLDAWLRLLALAFAPLVVLAALSVVYSWAVQSEILRWIDGVKLAIVARRRGGGEAPVAPEDAAMPQELRDFAAAFNEMARESAIREDSLKRSLAENEFLLRELHHRVKNSLQIVQSYLSLTRRLDAGSAGSDAIAAMEARVQVLAIAYRKAFSEGRMRDVRVRLFAEELARTLAQIFRRPGFALELEADVTTALMLDRAIPMGLALVEAVMAGLQAKGARVVRIRIAEDPLRRLELSVSTDGALAADAPDRQLMAGLALQLGAAVEDRGPGVAVDWRFQGAPPPALALSHASPAAASGSPPAPPAT